MSLWGFTPPFPFISFPMKDTSVTNTIIIIITKGIQCSLCARHCPRCFACMTSLTFFQQHFFFWPHCVTWGILVPRPGIEPASPSLEAWSLNLCTTREVCQQCFKPALIVLILEMRKLSLGKINSLNTTQPESRTAASGTQMGQHIQPSFPGPHHARERRLVGCWGW